MDSSSSSSDEIVALRGGGFGAPTIPAGEEGRYRGERTNVLGGSVSYLFKTNFTRATVAPGAFGGPVEIPFTKAETGLVCSMQRSLPEVTSPAMLEWMAKYIGKLINRDYRIVQRKLSDLTLCKR
ncbi:MAG: hypothetical protein Q7R81_02565 [Candidatus Peregrinibacteria bacterium]|nr:hypothetical protein [Candidatus Peregrinibacteria bacterium]